MRLARSALAALAILAPLATSGRAAVVAPSVAPAQANFSVADLLRGRTMIKAECDATDAAVWVTADGSSECLRYFMSAAPTTSDAVVVLHGDFVNADNGAAPQVTAADYSRTGPEAEKRDASALADFFGRTAIILARPGTFGSSGNELKVRHTVHEARLIDAALDAIAARHGIRRFHLVGQSGGAILVGALLSMRGDIACASIGAGRLAISPAASASRDIASERGETMLDDQTYVGGIFAAPGLRAFVISDPADIRSAFAGQQQFVMRARLGGVPVLQLSTVANYDRGAHHDVLGQAIRVLAECIDGTPDDRIAAIVQHLAERNARAWAQQAIAPRPRQGEFSPAASAASAKVVPSKVAARNKAAIIASLRAQ